jgi:hypothetical protein
MKAPTIAGVLLVATPAIATAQGTGNPAHDMLMKESPTDQRLFLGYLAGTAGYPCKVTEHEFKGMHRGDAYHLVSCSNGESYMVTVEPDAEGSTVVTDCAMFRLVGADCFAPWD